MSTFLAPTSLDEVLAALAAGARPIAGGTDLVVGARQGKKPLPDALVAIHRLDELREITYHEKGIRLGALVTHAQIVADAVLRESYTALVDASAIVGSHATRAQGTIGGNVMNASPAMDTGGPLLCFGATAVLQSASGTRRLRLDELWLSPGKTAARPDELLVAIDLQALPAGTGSCYARLEYRRQMEIAVVGATAVLTASGETVSSAAVAMTALSATIRRVPTAESALIGQVSHTAILSAAAAVAEASLPISDVRASAEYRRAMANVISRRTITAALSRAQHGAGVIPFPASSSLTGAR